MLGHTQKRNWIPLQLSTIDSNIHMSIKALIESGATGLFIDIEYVRSKNIWM